MEQNREGWRGFPGVPLFLVMLLVLLAISSAGSQGTTRRIAYSELKTLIREGQIQEVELGHEVIRGRLRDAAVSTDGLARQGQSSTGDPSKTRSSQRAGIQDPPTPSGAPVEQEKVLTAGVGSETDAGLPAAAPPDSTASASAPSSQSTSPAAATQPVQGPALVQGTAPAAAPATSVSSPVKEERSGGLSGMVPGCGMDRTPARIVETTRLQDDPELIKLLDAQGIRYSASAESPWLGPLFWWLILPFGLFLFLNFMMRRGMGGGPQVMTFGKNRARLIAEEGTDITFADVAGIDEAKEELEEVVAFLKTPERFQKLGGRIPKGVLLVGPPGTGKTLLARAVAGEAHVPFFSLSGSDFVEMFVGVGAARVRDLFEQAMKKAPCIIFIDELDAIGKARGGAGAISSNDEREQTLNQLLVEMDGFDARKSVIIMAATNRPEILDPALLRAGRFDRTISVPRPDLRGREQILKVHAKKITLNPTVELKTIAQRTPGFAGSDLANIVNEAALMAARKGRDAVELTDFDEAIERVVAGLSRKQGMLNVHEKRIVAYHESGHTVVAASVQHADPVHKVSIIPRGVGALGYTLQMPTEDRYMMSRGELRDRIAVLLGGRAAEALIFQEISTGASDDLARATEIARRMVKEYGMSERLGQRTWVEGRRASFLGNESGWPMSEREYSEQTQVAIDEEVSRLVDEGYRAALNHLEARRDCLESLAQKLLDEEVVERDALEAMLGKRPDADSPPDARPTSIVTATEHSAQVPAPSDSAATEESVSS